MSVFERMEGMVYISSARQIEAISVTLLLLTDYQSQVLTCLS